MTLSHFIHEFGVALFFIPDTLGIIKTFFNIDTKTLLTVSCEQMGKPWRQLYLQHMVSWNVLPKNNVRQLTCFLVKSDRFFFFSI